MFDLRRSNASSASIVKTSDRFPSLRPTMYSVMTLAIGIENIGSFDDPPETSHEIIQKRLALLRTRAGLRLVPVVIAPILYSFGAFCGLLATGAATMWFADDFGLLTTHAGLGFGSFGFVAEASVFAYAFWRSTHA